MRSQRSSRLLERRAALRWLASAASIGLCAGLLCASAASAASAAPVWTITSTGLPTDFMPGGSENGYRLTVMNSGAATADPSSDPITIADALPAGLTATAITAIDENDNTLSTSCTLATLTCSFSSAVDPGGVISVFISVSVPPGMPQGTLINSATVSGAGISSASTTDTTPISVSQAPFGLDEFSSSTVEADGSPARQAGGHPYSTNASFSLATVGVRGAPYPTENPKEIITALPPGLVGDPAAVPRCSPLAGGVCPVDSQVGEAVIYFATTMSGGIPGLGGYTVEPIYNVVPQDGSPAEFVFNVVKATQRLVARVRSNGDYGISVVSSQISEAAPVTGASVTFWGVPGDPSHDFARGRICDSTGGCGQFPGGEPFTGIEVKPLLTSPTACGGPLSTTLTAASWQNPTNFVSASATTPAMIGCDRLAFGPSIGLLPDTSQADAPSGLDVGLSVPQTDAVGALATPALKDATVTLPPGMTLSPASADGLQGCSREQIALSSLAAATCPDASKLGTVEIVTPVLSEPLQGSIFLATPDCAPCSDADAQDGRLAHGYIEAAGQGVRIKLAGTFAVDPASGQITAHFDDNPQLPFSDLKLHFAGGPRGPLTTPPTCGSFATHSVLSPWSAPSTPDAIRDSPFTIDQGCGAAQGFLPTLDAGVLNPTAGGSSPFTLTVSRESGENIGAVDVTLPPGLLAKLAGVPRCAEEQASAGTCPAASQIGHVTVAVGPGSAPLYVPQAGKAPTAVYLAGPYKGAPFSLVIRVPAQAGPFDLGTVTVRAALYVDPTDAHVTVKSDPLPQMLAGIPLSYRRINVVIDRPEFVLNPTNCNALAIGTTLTSAPGSKAAVTSPFQVANCAHLRFAPSFSAATAGNGNFHGASLDVKVAQKPGEAAIDKLDTQLPLALPSRLVTLQKACTEAQFASNPAGCPAGSSVGTARASTPLLNSPLTGPAYLVSHGGAAFPDLDLVLQGEGVTIALVGHTDIKKGITFSRFETVPDAPISSFELNLPGGAGALLAAIKPLCAPRTVVTVRKHVTRRVNGRLKRVTVKVKKNVPESLLMPTTITGQNGAVVKRATRIAVTGCTKAKAKKRSRKKTRARHSSHKRG
jgi:hypothetical protein